MSGVTITYTQSAQESINMIMRALGIVPELRAKFQATVNSNLELPLNLGINSNPPRTYTSLQIQVTYEAHPKLAPVSRWFTVALTPRLKGRDYAYLVTDFDTTLPSSELEFRRRSTRHARRQIADSPPGPVALFQGYSTFSGAGQATAVGGDFSPTNPLTTNKWSVCTDFSSVSTSLAIDTSVSQDEFLVSSNSVSAQFANSLHLTQYSVTILVNCSSFISSEATSYNLLPTVTPPDDTDSLAQFIATNGDQFVSSITAGVQLLAAYVFYCTSLDEQTTVTAQLKGQDLDEDGEVDADFGTNPAKVSQSVSTRQAFTSQLVGLNLAPPSTPADIWTFLPQINAASVSPGYVASVTTTPYEDVGLLEV